MCPLKVFAENVNASSGVYHPSKLDTLIQTALMLPSTVTGVFISLAPFFLYVDTSYFRMWWCENSHFTTWISGLIINV